MKLIGITFVDESKDFDVEISCESGFGRGKRSWLAGIDGESGSDSTKIVHRGLLYVSISEATLMSSSSQISARKK